MHKTFSSSKDNKESCKCPHTSMQQKKKTHCCTGLVRSSTCTNGLSRASRVVSSASLPKHNSRTRSARQTLSASDGVPPALGVPPAPGVLSVPPAVSPAPGVLSVPPAVSPAPGDVPPAPRLLLRLRGIAKICLEILNMHSSRLSHHDMTSKRILQPNNYW